MARCEKLKYEHMQQFITKVREELQEWWDKCHYSKKQRDLFTLFNSGMLCKISISNRLYLSKITSMNK